MKLPSKSNNVREVKMIEVIEIVAYEGEGTEESPARLINQYYRKDGELLAENDEWLNKILRSGD